MSPSIGGAPKLQLIFILAVVLIDLNLTSSYSPYIDDTDDIFALIAHWCTVSILLFTVALQVGAVRSKDSGIGPVFVVLLFAVVIGYIGYAVDYAWEDVRAIPKHVLSVKNRTSSTISSARKSVLRTTSTVFGTMVNKKQKNAWNPRPAEAGWDPTPSNDQYFPGCIPNETNTTDAKETEMGIIEAPDQKPTEEADLSNPVYSYRKKHKRLGRFF